jgi:hypothetical protein
MMHPTRRLNQSHENVMKQNTPRNDALFFEIRTTTMAEIPFDSAFSSTIKVTGSNDKKPRLGIQDFQIQ